MTNVLKEFFPRNEWKSTVIQKIDEGFVHYVGLVTDKTSSVAERVFNYIDDSASVLWLKNAALALAAPIVLPVALAILTIYQAFRFVNFFVLCVLAAFGDKEAREYVRENWTEPFEIL